MLIQHSDTKEEMKTVDSMTRAAYEPAVASAEAVGRGAWFPLRMTRPSSSLLGYMIVWCFPILLAGLLSRKFSNLPYSSEVLGLK